MSDLRIIPRSADPEDQLEVFIDSGLGIHSAFPRPMIEIIDDHPGGAHHCPICLGSENAR